MYLQIPYHRPWTAIDHGYELVKEHLLTARIYSYSSVGEVPHLPFYAQFNRYSPDAVTHPDLLNFARYPDLYRLHLKHRNLSTPLDGCLPK